MEIKEALDLVVERTGHVRFRELLDPTHPDFNPGYESVVMQLATGEPPPAPQSPPLNAADLPLAGDLVAALTKRIGVERAVKYVADKLGVECGCPQRQAKLNKLDASVRKFLGW